jgi:hypothetical protein
MKKLAALVVVVLGCGVGWGQAAQTDSQVLQEILVEMRGIHNDVRLSQTTQILLTELEVEHGAVDKAIEKRDTARIRVSQLQMNEKNFAAQIAQNEENAKTMTLDPVQQKRFADQAQNAEVEYGERSRARRTMRRTCCRMRRASCGRSRMC